MSSEVFKILSAQDWADAKSNGTYPGSSDDTRDGFIHLSTAEQIPGTLQRHYADRENLVIVAFAAQALGPKLIFEASRDGQLFPHLYAPLPVGLATRYARLATDPNGNPTSEPAWLIC